MQYSLSNIPLKNYLVASSSPLTESTIRLKCCETAGFAAAILKSAAAYTRLNYGYGRKVVYVDDGYYADSSFEREILTLEEGINLFTSALEQCSSDMLIIPSISGSSLEIDEWLKSCKQFESCGALLVQLDFFYLSTMKHDNIFYNKLHYLLESLVQNLNCSIMPKLNMNFEPNVICKLLKESGVHTISLLDSMREDPDISLGLHKGTTSYFGKRQFQYTRKYLKIAKQYGLEVCAGGGVTSKSDVDLLLKDGANMVQIASYILCRDFSAASDLLIHGNSSTDTIALKHSPWCDCENGEECEKCGACVAH